MELRREAVLPSDVRKVIIGEQQQDWSSGLDQEDPDPLTHIKEDQQDWSSDPDQEDPDPPTYIKEEQQDQEDPELPHIKEEQEDWSSDLDQEHPELPHLTEDQHEVWSSGLDQEDPEPPHIKEEQEEGEQLQGLEDCGGPGPARTSDLEPESGGEDCGGPGPARTSDPEPDAGDSSDPETDDSTDWKETRDRPSGSRSLNDEELPEKLFSCSVCEETFSSRSRVQTHQCVGCPSSKLHQPEDSGGEEPPEGPPGPARTCDPGPDPDIKSDPHVDVEFWTETRKHQSGFTYQRNKKTSSSPEDQAGPEVQTDPDPPGPQHGSSDPGRNTDMKPSRKSPTSGCSLPAPAAGQVTEQEVLSCSVCNAVCRDSEALVQHMRGHTRQTQFRCNVCGEEFAWRRFLSKHMEIHTNHKFYSCSGCHQRYTRLYLLRNHKCSARQQPEQEHHDGQDRGGPGPGPGPARTSDPEPEKLFSCSDCGKSFRFKGDLKRHVRSHTGEKPFSCSVCDKRFSRRGCLKTHMLTHTGEKPFICSTCGKRFTQKFHLTRHMTLHEDVLSCSVFGDRFPWLSAVQRTNGLQDSPSYEALPVIEARKPFSCSECEKRFRFKTCLKKHMRIHTGEKPFSCSLCGKAFSLSANLKVHMRIHTGEKSFICSVAACGKRFGFKGDLKRHMRTHTGEKPFSCPVCQKAFTQSGSLHNHKKIHTGEKPFVCSLCAKRFLAKAHLKNHMMRHTGEKRFSCSVCEQRFTWNNQLRSHRCGDAAAAETKHSTDRGAS